MAQTNIIELNGKRYDAATGEFLGAGDSPLAKHVEARKAHRGRSMDIMPSAHRAAPHHAATHEPAKPAAAKTSPTNTNKTPSPAKPQHHTARQHKAIAAHQPQKSNILMRTAVKKPNFKMKTAIKTQAPAEMAAAPVATIVPKASAYRLEPRRAARAQSVVRSQRIQRFAADRAPHNAAVAVAPSNVTAATLQSSARVFVHPQPQRANPSNVQRPAQRATQTSTTAVASTSSQDVFEAAIAHASSHLEPAPKVSRHRSRWLHVTAVAITFLAIGAAVMWANKANIEVHFASMRAGFHIIMPTYSPDGYALSGNVQTNNGRVTLTYRSGSASYSVTEQASSWDSATLASSTVALQHSPQQMQTAGRTVYLYGNGNAMWVDGGVLYNLVANGSLTNAEIANLVAGL